MAELLVNHFSSAATSIEGDHVCSLTEDHHENHSSVKAIRTITMMMIMILTSKTLCSPSQAQKLQKSLGSAFSRDIIRLAKHGYTVKQIRMKLDLQLVNTR